MRSKYGMEIIFSYLKKSKIELSVCSTQKDKLHRQKNSRPSLGCMKNDFEQKITWVLALSPLGNGSPRGKLYN